MAHTFSLDTGPYEIIAEALAVSAESDPLEILIAEEEEFDVEFALDVVRMRHLKAGRQV